MSKMSSHELKKIQLVTRGIIKANPKENVLFQQHQPHGFALNLSGHCNAKCTYCPQSLSEQPEEFINPLVVDRLLESTRNVPSYFQFGTRGENLLNPNFIEYMNRIKRNNPLHYITVNTNGLIFEGALRTGVLRSGIDQLIFSIQTCDPDIYCTLTQNPSYEKVLDIVLDTINERDQLKVDCMIGVQFLDTQENHLHYPAFLEFWDKYDVFTYKQTVHGWGDKFKNNDDSSNNRYPCQCLWLYPNISHKGNVCSCYADFYDEQVYGNLLNDRLETIWLESPLRKEMMKNHLEGRWDKHALCKECNGWKEFPNIFDYQQGRFELSVND